MGTVDRKPWAQGSSGFLERRSEREGKSRDEKAARKPGLGVGSAGYGALIRQGPHLAARPWTPAGFERSRGKPPTEHGAVNNIDQLRLLFVYSESSPYEKAANYKENAPRSEQGSLFLYNNYF